MRREEGCIVFENEISDFNEFTFSLKDIEVNVYKSDDFAIEYQFDIPFRYLEQIFSSEEDCENIISLWEDGEIGEENSKLNSYLELINKLTSEIDTYIGNKLNI